MKTNSQSQNHQGYKVHTNQKAGLSCDGQKQHLEQHIAQCALYQTKAACDGIGDDVLCLVSGCGETVACPK